MKNEIRNLINLFKSIDMSIFTWDIAGFNNYDNYIERLLTKYGRCAFFIFNNELLCTPFDYTDQLDYMQRPTKINCYVYNHGVVTIPISKCVILYSRDNDITDLAIIKSYVHRLIDVYSTLDAQLVHARKPLLIISDNYDSKSINNFIADINSNRPAIPIRNRNFEIQTINTNVNYVGSELLNTYVNLKNELLMYLGVYANNTVKTERVTTAETTNDNTFTSLVLYNKSKNRENACVNIKKLFNINASITNNIYEIETDLLDNALNAQISRLGGGVK